MKTSGISGNPWRQAAGWRAFCCALALATAGPARAMELYSGDGIEARWDNTIRYSLGVRLASPSVVQLAYPNSDDGDRNFAAGLMSDRLDILSVLDVTAENFGAQISVAAWYDSVYHAGTDNRAGINQNAGATGRFPTATSRLDGADAELADSFVYANLSLDQMPLILRAGRQTLLWGESLFYSSGSIAAAMAPVDYLKTVASPDSYARSSYLPLNQLLATLQPDADTSISAYYQLEFRPARLPGVGSYFSTTDLEGAGADLAFAGPRALTHGSDRYAPDGGFGIALHRHVGEFDLGLYALQYTSPYSVLQAYPQGSNGGEFYSGYPRAIGLFGVSASTYIDDVTVAGEAAIRTNAPLVSSSPISLYTNMPLREEGYARGDTMHLQASALDTLAPTQLWDSADASLEFTTDSILAMTHDATARSARRDHFTAAGRLLFQPHYFQVLPNLDISPQFGLGYDFLGNSPTDYTAWQGTGDYELGVSATWLTVWKLDLTMTSFIGDARRQPLSDRNFLLLGLERTF